MDEDNLKDLGRESEMRLQHVCQGLIRDRWWWWWWCSFCTHVKFHTWCT